MQRRVASLATLVILDIDLGSISGIELRQRLAASGANLPVIFITAADDDATYHSALQAGCCAYLRKPFMAHQLLAAMDEPFAPSCANARDCTAPMQRDTAPKGNVHLTVSVRQ